MIKVKDKIPCYDIFSLVGDVRKPLQLSMD